MEKKRRKREKEGDAAGGVWLSLTKKKELVETSSDGDTFQTGSFLTNLSTISPFCVLLLSLHEFPSFSARSHGIRLGGKY